MSQKPILWIGIGCQRGISSQLVNIAVGQTMQKHQLADHDLVGMATIDTKASEVALVDFCRQRNLLFKMFTATDLSNVNVPNPTKITLKKVGVPSVAEASAILAASQLAPISLLLVPKQIVRLPDLTGSITIAVAQAVHQSGELKLIPQAYPSSGLRK
jgi:cobalamin biosynthesis protein CbiG